MVLQVKGDTMHELVIADIFQQHAEDYKGAGHEIRLHQFKVFISPDAAFE